MKRGNSQVKIIAITGGVATGKTTVAKILSSLLKAKIIDADEIVHELLVPGEKIWKEVVRCFGEDILRKDLYINKKILGQCIFGDISQRKKLEQIVHPAVKKNIKEKLKQLRKDHHEWVIVDIPLLFEAKMQKIADKVIVVVRKRKFQLETLRKIKKLSAKEAENRINSQLPLSEKVKLADFVVDNNGEIQETEKQVRETLFSLKNV
ncbi:MAG: dephospho-CoA kinase [Candidatus Omnitrophica bacterium]|nr:dephospho-CoA kinase [Candidatus Omnitrophota bacterium]MBU1048177.1 dephospho-CoA kinase [Candidatus Omnitrophota bacterium]MBU1630804.1 dephospho-CoA kinase [Candidatus Omnitrophota bacterium]MBU1889655.1 dephospho-CoA kinase [Candidatus Omnitrophota bacterium]